MALFKLENNKLKKVSVQTFKYEKELQKLCEENLEELFQVKFVCTEFPFGDEYSGRLDTVGLDYDGNPVIIEYKLDKNSAVLSQCLFYMDWLINHKGDFEKAAKEKLGFNVEINWNNPKMIIVAQDYNKYDKYAVNRINYDIYLYKYTLYSNGELFLENINVQENKKYSIPKDSSKNEEHEKYARYEYDVDYHLSNANDNIKNLYKDLNEKIMEISDKIDVRFPKNYIGYRTTRNFLEVYIKKNYLTVYFLDYDKSDILNLEIERVPESYQWAVNYRTNINKADDLEELMKLVNYSYKSTL